MKLTNFQVGDIVYCEWAERIYGTALVKYVSEYVMVIKWICVSSVHSGAIAFDDRHFEEAIYAHNLNEYEVIELKLESRIGDLNYRKNSLKKGSRP